MSAHEQLVLLSPRLSKDKKDCECRAGGVDFEI